MRALLLTLIMGCLAAGDARAEQVSYDLSIRGITLGRLTLAAEETPQRYSVAARITNSGVTRVFRRFSYRGQAQGSLDGQRLRPALYIEQADTGRRVSEVELRYAGGVPQVIRYTSPAAAGPDAPDPSTQGGTLDPLSGVYAMLRDVPPEAVCDLDVLLFDGRRQSRIAMRPAGPAAGLPTCTGSYERLKGFTAEETARHRRFDFRLFYAPGAGGKLQVDRVVFQSLYGQSMISRR